MNEETGTEAAQIPEKKNINDLPRSNVTVLRSSFQVNIFDELLDYRQHNFIVWKHF